MIKARCKADVKVLGKNLHHPTFRNLFFVEENVFKFRNFLRFPEIAETFENVIGNELVRPANSADFFYPLPFTLGDEICGAGHVRDVGRVVL